MYYLRNRVSHEYFGVDLDLVWNIIANEIDSLRASLSSILKSLPE